MDYVPFEEKSKEEQERLLREREEEWRLIERFNQSMIELFEFCEELERESDKVDNGKEAEDYEIVEKPIEDKGNKKSGGDGGTANKSCTIL